jgi:hypothetical protein
MNYHMLSLACLQLAFFIVLLTSDDAEVHGNRQMPSSDLQFFGAMTQKD